MKRRNKKTLEKNISAVKSRKAKAIANYKLALFHDNNNREKEAIPLYKTSISLGLTKDTKAEALAWLSSSLYKTNQPKEAIKRLRQAQQLTKNKKLVKFLSGLEKRIEKNKF